MERFHSVLLNVWREACRHIEIVRSAEAITPLLLKDIPAEQLLVRRIDVPRSCVETVAWGLPVREGDQAESRTDCSALELRRLLAWWRRSRAGRGLPADRQKKAWHAAVPRGIDADVLVAPIGDLAHLAGIVVLIAPPKRQFIARHVELIEALRPFLDGAGERPSTA